MNTEIKTKIGRITSCLLGGFFVFGSSLFIVKYFSDNYKLGVNITPSIDEKLAIYDKKFNWVNDNEIKDKLIWFELPKETAYFPKNTDFGKFVKCSGGEMLETSDDKRYFCNGKEIGKAENTDSKGVKVNNFVFNGYIPNGKYFVMGTHQKSYDSRYWGFVDKSNIKGVSVWEK